jgi:hypothetical protein
MLVGADPDRREEGGAVAEGDKQRGPDGLEVPGGPPPAPRAPRPSVDLTGDAGWLFATRVLGLAGAAALLGLSVWLGHAAIRSGASLPAALAMFAGALVLLGAGLFAAIVGVLGWPARMPGRADPLEVKAGDLGLPTDPEAYQDGGLAEAATAYTAPEAELIAGVLKGADIPAWVDAPRVANLYGTTSPALFPGGIRVLVPMGRLADARELLAEHRPAPAPEGPEDDRRPRWLVRLFATLIVSSFASGILISVCFMVLSAFVDVPEGALWAVGLPLTLVITAVLMVVAHRTLGRRPS